MVVLSQFSHFSGVPQARPFAAVRFAATDKADQPKLVTKPLVVDTADLSATTPSDKPTRPPAFFKFTFNEVIKNGAVVGLTLMLAPLLGPAVMGALGGAKVVSTVVFGMLVPAAVEYGFVRFGGRLDQFQLWLGERFYQPVKRVVDTTANSVFGRVLSKQPKQWAANVLEKLNPETLTKALETRLKTAEVGGKQALQHPLNQFFAQLRHHQAKLGWGPSVLIGLHRALGETRKQHTVAGIPPSRVGCLSGCRSLFQLKGLRLGVVLKQLLVANMVAWTGMKLLNGASRLVYRKSIDDLAASVDLSANVAPPLQK